MSNTNATDVTDAEGARRTMDDDNHRDWSEALIKRRGQRFRTFSLKERTILTRARDQAALYRNCNQQDWMRAERTCPPKSLRSSLSSRWLGRLLHRYERREQRDRGLKFVGVI
mmetsp:Transcript_12400/g.25260  ORF Transcript_12400/g.25260 Transcript_12400/m.25260 type:complete len:113 (+) Transcript_12400:119-457(+)